MNRFFLIVILFLGSVLSAQETNVEGDLVESNTKKWSLDFGGSVGLLIPFDKEKDIKSQVGLNAVTFLQFNYKNYFSRFQLGQTTVDVNYKNNYGTVNSSVSAKSNSTHIGLLVGYQKTFGKWQPYAMLGAGVSFIDIPTSDFDKVKNEVNFKTVNGTYLQTNYGLGVNYKISKTFILFTEGQVSTIPNTPKNSITHLSGITAFIGIKAPL